MALISCPECGHQVSDSAATCPNCGVAIKKEEIPKTKIGELKRNYLLGAILFIIGIFIFFVSIPLIGMILGIFSAVGALAIAGYGLTLILGRKDCTCPYCGKPGKLSESDLSYQCPGCKRTSFVKANYLQP